MKSLVELDHYEVLEVGREASREEIERAHRLIQDAYDDDSLGLYSVFDAGEAALLRERADLAYRVLSDPEARRAYDTRLAEAGHDEQYEAAAPEPAAPSEPDSGFAALEEIEDEDAPWDGARLRRSRLLRGLDVGEIAQVTKINPTYLRFLEEERFDVLPAPVYVRGFVAAYARCLGLDPARVATRYMRHLEASQPSPRSRMRGSP